ncbi:MAG TPA: alpha/beta hydrolase [Phnomibacter sp.]|nr:alpha/beta hydrolase [Phnomibacter sp.]
MPTSAPTHFHIYCISGLAADFGIFKKLQISNATLHPIRWEIPEENDTLPTFAKKLATQITHPNAILLGVSFGGMLATEIAAIQPLYKTIIVSSCKHHNELPTLIRWAAKLKLHRWIPYWLVTRSHILSRFLFDTRSKAEELYLKRSMLQQTDLRLMKRSVNMILGWQSDKTPANIIHIHGKQDRLLTAGHVSPNYWVEGGGHFMIWNMANEISQLIEQELQKEQGHIA